MHVLASLRSQAGAQARIVVQAPERARQRLGVAPTGGGALSPTDRSAIAAARGNGSPVGIGGGAPVTPGGPGITASSVTRALPVPLLVVLILLGLGAAAGAGVAIRNRVVSGRQA